MNFRKVRQNGDNARFFYKLNCVNELYIIIVSEQPEMS